MSKIAEFLDHYRREVDFYQEVSRLVAQQIESRLQSAGIRAMVTFRAKKVDSLEKKLQRRSVDRDYDSVGAIAIDIVDLAGVRIALYFPADRSEVDKLLRAQFDLVEKPRVFPIEQPTSNYSKRFDGYHAVHYRAKLRESSLPTADSRYATAPVEIQVASVLMHAWSEVEHDLVYKPTSGQLSEDEHAILDELNGMVLAGEIALERLQRAVQHRVSGPEVEFRNHYDLAAYLYDAAREQQLEPEKPAMGSADVLFDLLREAGLSKPSQIEPYVSSLREATEKRPLAEQMIDLLVSGNPDLYSKYSDLRSESRDLVHSVPAGPTEEDEAAVGRFLTAWIEVEKSVRKISGANAPSSPIPFARLLHMVNLSPKDRVDIRHLHDLRNQVVHGLGLPPLDSLREATARLERLIGKLARSQRGDT